VDVTKGAAQVAPDTEGCESIKESIEGEEREFMECSRELAEGEEDLALLNLGGDLYASLDRYDLSPYCFTVESNCTG